MHIILGLDIGGTHLSGGLIREETGEFIEKSFVDFPIHSDTGAETVIGEWANAISHILNIDDAELTGIGIAMPGPFDYNTGISYIRNQAKFEALYGVNIKSALIKRLNLPDGFPIIFQNDAICFGLGEFRYGVAKKFKKTLSITLGTGLGACFLDNGLPVQEGNGVPEGGTLFQVPYKNEMAEYYFSARGLVREFRQKSATKISNAKDIYQLAMASDPIAHETLKDFGEGLGHLLVPYLREFEAECLVLGGNITNAADFFLEPLKAVIKQNDLHVEVVLSSLRERAAVLGAAGLLEKNFDRQQEQTRDKLRETGQFLLPLKKNHKTENAYDVYPVFDMGPGKIHTGYNALTDDIIRYKTVLIDGYAGVFWDNIKNQIKRHLPDGLSVNIIDTKDWLRSEDEITGIVKNYLGEENSPWGTRCDKELADFFDKDEIGRSRPDPDADINIVVGVGAALCGWNAPIVYVDLPKNELQYRMRAKSITNLGCSKAGDNKAMYKRFYFVDWIVLNKHKKNILNRIKILADDQRPEGITSMYFDDLKDALHQMSENVFRVRPWFEPGVWGGEWIKDKIGNINKQEFNYAWSFELITPENGLLFESDGLLAEASFDFIMYLFGEQVLGAEHARRFGDEFPIRFDFLDTVNGGNLSIQCHPSNRYIRENFGENFTQDETYYILDAEDDAGVYLGFRDNIQPKEFRNVLETSNEDNTPIKIKDYVQYFASKKHDLFLIPNQTIHSAGSGNLVLEISATPYIYTFKMYDWVRLDLDGKPRPINIGHAFNNLDFTRKGDKVWQELIAHPEISERGPDWKVIHLPTHAEHFYDIHRVEFKTRVEVQTNGSCHVLMVVDGKSVLIKTKNGYQQRFYYAETFVIPAAAISYTIINEGPAEAKVLKAFLK